MERSDFNYHPLSEADYEAIITAGEVFRDDAGNIIRSPLHGHDNWAAAEAAAKAADIDLRVLLAATLFEDHHGTDPAGGTELAKVFNFGGIKWAGQPGAFDSGIPYPRNEGIGNYAGFHDFGGFVAELVRTLNNEYIGDAFRAGDLARAWGIYVGGPNNPNMAAGHSRVDQFQYYLSKFPAEGEATVVTGQDVLTEALKWEGCTDRGLYDPTNGHGTPFMWCEAYIESMHEHAGIFRVRYASALAFLNDPNIETHSTWPAPAGACILYGRNIDPAGHVTISLGDGQQIGTARNSIKIDHVWPGVAGWQWYPGVLAPRPPAPVADVFYVDDNPHGRIPVRMPFWARWDQMNTMGTPLDHPGAVNPAGLALPMLGYPTEPEYATQTGRRIQRFERAVLATYNGEDPWDVVTLLRDEAPLADAPA
jgi:hypothetical protein